MRNTLGLLMVGIGMAAQGETVGLWRFEEDGAVNDGLVAAALNNTSPGTLDASVGGGNPLYSDDVPAAEIFDPVSGATYTNLFSLDATSANSQLGTERSCRHSTNYSSL